MDSPRCAACGRLLADPASRARALGPVCARRLSARTAPSMAPRHPTAASAPHIDGQTELDINHQPTLWST